MALLDPDHPIDFAGCESPPNYVCSQCGATGRKLWRDYQMFARRLLCAPCAAEDQGKDASDIDANGQRPSSIPGQRTYEIGWMVPAIPTAENDGFWGYASVPDTAVAWWRRLPTI
jgi:hypothetical protein